MMTPCRSLALATALAIVGSATPVAAVEFVEHYKLGMAAVESEDWDQVGEMMARAIAIQPNSKARIKKALFFKQYLPHFYLGMSLYKSGDCVGALTAWQESEGQGIVQKFPEFNQLEAGRQSCLQHMSDVDSTISEARSLIADAEAARAGARKGLEDLQVKGIEYWESLSEHLRQAESNLHEAEVLIGQADRDLETLQRSASKAARARDGFESISLASSKWLQSMASEQVEMRAQLNQLVVAGVQGLRATEYLEPYPPRVEYHRNRVEGLVAQVSDLDSSAGNDEVEQLATELDEAISALEWSTTKPPRVLTSAAEAFLSGHYRQVLEVLADISHNSPRVSAQAHLLQAAALFAQFHADGETQMELLAQAKQDVLSCQSLGKAEPNPSPQVFSPRFIEFFEAQRAPVVAEIADE